MRRIAILCILVAAAQGAPPTKINPKDGLAYVSVAPGAFWMGCSADDRECFAWEKPARPITIRKRFWIGQTEVTQSAYRRVTDQNPSNFKGAQLPVDRVSWFDARAYCAATGMRLPTEAEWEYAARGGSPLARYGALKSVAWYQDNTGETTHEVARKQPNAFGLYDTLGNVWEWVEDAYTGSGKNQRLLKGGAWYNIPRDVRVSNRLWATPETAHRDMGFRCAGD